jgi:putative ABC transport system permease protein
VSLRHRLGGRVPTLLSAVRNLSRAKLRSGLAAAAIFVGVVSIVIVGAGGDAFERSQLRTLEQRGVTYVFVAPGIDSETDRFTREDVREIRETVGSTGVVATADREADWRRRGDDLEVSVSYVDSTASLRRVEAVERGSIPRNWRRELVVSGEFAAEHGIETDDRLVLDPREDGGPARPYRVVAVLAESDGIGGTELYLPIAALEERRYTQLRIVTDSAARAEATAELLRTEFNGREDRLLVFELTSLLRLFTALVNGINSFLVGIVAVSMVVAGVSITNTMLMAVIRRREEIGVLRAVGYGRGDVVRILLTEAGLLGGLGAAAGLAAGVPVVMLVNGLFLGDPLAFSTTALGYLVGAAAFGVVTSLVAGAYPAWRAATERPVEALRG